MDPSNSSNIQMSTVTKQLDGMNLTQLRGMAKHLKIKHTGLKPILIQRIITTPHNGIKFNLNESRAIALQKFKHHKKADSAAEMHGIIIKTFSTWSPFKVDPQSDYSWMNKIKSCINLFNDTPQNEHQLVGNVIGMVDGEANNIQMELDQANDVHMEVDDVPVERVMENLIGSRDNRTVGNHETIESQMSWMSITLQSLKAFLKAKEEFIQLNQRTTFDRRIASIWRKQLDIITCEFKGQLPNLAKLQDSSKVVIATLNNDVAELIENKVKDIVEKWKLVSAAVIEQEFLLENCCILNDIWDELKRTITPLSNWLKEVEFDEKVVLQKKMDLLEVLEYFLIFKQVVPRIVKVNTRLHARVLKVRDVIGDCIKRFYEFYCSFCYEKSTVGKRKLINDQCEDQPRKYARFSENFSRQSQSLSNDEENSSISLPNLDTSTGEAEILSGLETFTSPYSVVRHTSQSLIMPETTLSLHPENTVSLPNTDNDKNMELPELDDSKVNGVGSKSSEVDFQQENLSIDMENEQFEEPIIINEISNDNLAIIEAIIPKGRRQCVFCLTAVASNKFTRHIRCCAAAKEAPRCSRCYVPFKSVEDVNNHKVYSNGSTCRYFNKKKACSFCYRALPDSQLHNHMSVCSRNPEVNRDVQCDICERWFTNKVTLIIHLTKSKCRSRTTSKHICVCGLQFPNKHYCQVQRSAMKKYDFTFSCNFCDENYLILHDIQQHQSHVHYIEEDNQRKFKLSQIFEDANTFLQSNDQVLIRLGLALICAYKYMVRTTKGDKSFQKDVFTLTQNDFSIKENIISFNFLYGKSHMFESSFILTQTELAAFQMINIPTDPNTPFFSTTKIYLEHYMFKKFGVTLPQARKAAITILYISIMQELISLGRLEHPLFFDDALKRLSEITCHKSYDDFAKQTNTIHYIDPMVMNKYDTTLYEKLELATFNLNF